MNIGFDFDGVITDPVELKRQWILENRGINIAPDQTNKKKCMALIGRDSYVEMIKETYAGRLALQNRIRPEAVAVMGSLMRRGNMAYVITSRLNNEAVCAQRLISMYGVPHDGFFNTEDKPKDAICRDLGIELFVDDTQSKLAELVGIPGIKLVFFNVFGEETAPGIVSVASWEELERLIRDMC